MNGKVVGSKVLGVLNAYRLKQTAISTQDTIKERMQQSTLVEPPSHLEATVTEALTEMDHEVHQPKGCQEVINLLITGII